MAPVILAQHLNDRGYGCRLLYGHDLEALFRYRVVEADSQVALALIEEPLQVGLEPDGGEGDTPGAPCQPIVCHQQLICFFYVLVVVQRLTHAHEDQVGDLFRVGYRVYLVEYLSGGEVIAESLLAGHAEVAVHAAAHL